MQCTSVWAQIAFYVPLILGYLGEFSLCILLGIISWIKYVWTVRRFFRRNQPSNVIVKRPLFTLRDALGLFTRVPHLFVPDQWVMPLPDQIMHVEAALQRTVKRAEAQDKELRQLRLDLERSRLRNKEQRALINRLQFDVHSQKKQLEATVPKIAALNSQNTGLAGRVMAQHRRIFTLQQQTQKLEQEKIDHQALMREVASLKTLVAASLDSKKDCGTFRTAKRQRGMFSSEDASLKSSYIKTTPTLSERSLDSRPQDFQNQSHETSSNSPGHSYKTDHGHRNCTSPDSSVQAAKTEKRVRTRIMKKIDAGLSHCRTQGVFRDGFDLEKGGYKREKRVDSGPGLHSVFKMVYT